MRLIKCLYYGTAVGDPVGAVVGAAVGPLVGAAVGAVVGAAPGALVGDAVGDPAPTGETCACAGNNTLSTKGRVHFFGAWLPTEIMPPPTNIRRTALRRLVSIELAGFFSLSDLSLDIASSYFRNARSRIL